MVLTKKYVKEHKFDSLYDGPFRVHDVVDGTVTISKGKKLIKVHKIFFKKTKATYQNEPPHPFPIIELNEDELSEIMLSEIMFAELKTPN